MKKMSISKILIAGSMAASAIIPVAIFANDASTSESIKFSEENDQVYYFDPETTPVSEFTDGLNLPITEIPAGYTTVQVGESGSPINIEDGTATININILNEDKDAFLEEIPLNLIFAGETEDDKKEIEISLKIGEAPKESTYVTDITVSALSVEEDNLELYTSDTTKVNLTNISPDFVAIKYTYKGTEKTATVTDGTASIDVVYINEDKTAFVSNSIVTSLTFIKEDESEVTGSLTLPLNITPKTEVNPDPVTTVNVTSTANPEIGSDWVISGTYENATNITVKVGNDEAVPATLNPTNKTWSVTISSASATLSAAKAEDSIPVKVSANNGEETPVTVETAYTAKGNAIAETKVSITSTNTPTAGEEWIVSGTYDNANSVKVKVGSDEEVTATLNADNKTWSATISATSAAILNASGKSVDVIVTAVPETGTSVTDTKNYTVAAAPVTTKAVTFETGITVKANGVAVASGKNVDEGDVLTITPSVARGKSVKTISVNGTALEITNGSSSYTVKAADSAVAITVEYADAISYNATFPENVSMTVLSDLDNIVLKTGDKVYDGDSVKIQVTAPSGKTLKSLTLNGSAIENGKTITVNGTDLEVKAEFEDIATHTITFPSDVTVSKSDGTLITSGSSVAEGEVLKISASKAGYTLSSIKVNNEAFVSGGTYTVSTKNIEIETTYTTASTDGTEGTYEVTLKAYDDEDDTLKGVTILIKNSDKKTVATAVTDSKGKIELDLVPGKYSYAITDVPEGYLIPDSTYSFTVADTGKIRGTTSVTLSQSVVTITKTDSVTNKGVAGVSIVVKDEDKETVETAITDKDGKITIKGLPEGKYTYTERYPATGYVADNTVYSFSIDDEGNVKGTTKASCTPLSIIITVRDYATGSGISNAGITIKNTLGRTVATATTNSNGEASITGLSAGKYTLTQTSAPNGYSANTDEFTFNVLESGLVSGTTSITNKAKATNSQNGSSMQSSTTNGDNNSSTTKPSTSTNTSNTTKPNTSTNGTTTSNGSSTTTTTTTTGSNTYSGTIKTGVETEDTSNKAPLVAGIIGVIGIIGAAAGVVISKFKKH